MTFCWTPRYEALGFSDHVDALTHLPETELDRLARDAGYALVETDGYREWRWDVLSDTCLLPAGHAEAHEFTPEHQIVLTFSPGVPAVTRHVPGIVQAILIALLLAGAVAPTAARGEGVDVEALIVDAAERHGVDAGVMLRLAACESSLNPWAVGLLGERGIYQYRWFTWIDLAARAGVSTDYWLAFDPASAAEVTAATLARGEWTHWWGCLR